MDLSRLVRLLDLMEDEEIRLPMVEVSGSDKGVNLMTVHGSKGLEFEYVFVAGCNASFWEKKRKPGKVIDCPIPFLMQAGGMMIRKNFVAFFM